MISKFKNFCLVIILILSFSGLAQAADLFKLNFGGGPYPSTFFLWYADNQGWTKEAGLDINLVYLPDGPSQNEALHSGAWQVAESGNAGPVICALRQDVKLVGYGYWDGPVEAVIVRKNSDMTKIKGWNPKYPDVLGSPETVKGKMFLVPQGTIAEYHLGGYLKVFGLEIKDVIIKNMGAPQAEAALKAGIGDAVSIWAPHSISLAVHPDYEMASTGQMTGVKTGEMYYVDTKFLNKHPEIVSKWLAVLQRATDVLIQEGADALVKDYKTFLIEYGGMEVPDFAAKADLECQMFTIDESIEYLKSGGLREEQLGFATFSNSAGRFTNAELAKFKTIKLVDYSAVENAKAYMIENGFYYKR